MKGRDEEASERAFAEEWSSAVGPLWCGEVLPRLFEDGLGERIEGATGLVAECRTGDVVEACRQAWSGAARLMAVEPTRSLVDVARERARAGGGSPVFFKVEPVRSLTFAEDVFRGAVCLGNTHEGAGVFNALSSLARVVEPGGFICFGGLASDSFPLLMDLLTEHGWTSRVPEIRGAIDAYRLLPSVEQAIEESEERLDLDLEAAGGADLEVRLGPSGSVLEHPVFREFFDPRLLHLYDEDVDRSAARQYLRTAVEEYFGSEEVRDTLGLVWARFTVREPETYTVDDDDVIEEVIEADE